jgi:hypothetical protein
LDNPLSRYRNMKLCREYRTIYYVLLCILFTTIISKEKKKDITQSRSPEELFVSVTTAKIQMIYAIQTKKDRH